MSNLPSLSFLCLLHYLTLYLKQKKVLSFTLCDPVQLNNMYLWAEADDEAFLYKQHAKFPYGRDKLPVNYTLHQYWNGYIYILHSSHPYT